MPEYIDLTHIHTDDMPVYPGDPCARLYQTSWIKENGFSDHIIEGGMHVGTHMDAPLHMIESGKLISDLRIDQFKGRGLLINARGKTKIEPDILTPYTLCKGDVILIWTGWDKKFGTDQYYKDWPYFTEEFCDRLVNADIAMVCMDTPGPDLDAPFPAHKLLLKRQILIVENVTGLETLQDKENYIIHAYPPKYMADAAPVRVFAEIL